MNNFENVITQITKAKFGEKNRSFLPTLGISNWEIRLSVWEGEKVKILFYSVIKDKHLLEINSINVFDIIYHDYSCITHTPKFGPQNSLKKCFLYMLHTDFLELVEAKFKAKMNNLKI